MEKLKSLLPASVYNNILTEFTDSVESIVMADEKELQTKTQLPEEDLQKVIILAAQLIIKEKFVLASTIKAKCRLTTGCSAIDHLLGGGLNLNGITEIYGYSGVGKTQFCLQLALTNQLPFSKGGRNSGVVYISTERGFPLTRYNQLLQIFQKKYNCDLNLDNTYLDHIVDYNQLFRCLVRLQKLIAIKQINLIIIDSIAGIFRSETETAFTDRAQQFVQITSKLRAFSKCGVIVINQVTDNITTGITEPCLGLGWSNCLTTRICLSKQIQCREFEIVFSPELPISKCQFQITQDGITDV